MISHIGEKIVLWTGASLSLFMYTKLIKQELPIVPDNSVSSHMHIWCCASFCV